MLKIEGENRIDLLCIVADLADKYKVSNKTALRWLCVALQYNVVHEAFIEQIDYLLDQGVLPQ